jgi:hypothetical protein
LFRDEEKMKGYFITADIFNPSLGSELGKTKGTWDAINACMFLHQFSLEEQIHISKNILKLVKNEKGSIIIGAQSASTLPGEEGISAPFLKEGVVKKVWRHSKERFREIWESIMESEGVELMVWVEYRARYELGEVDEVQKRTEGYAFFDESTERV